MSNILNFIKQISVKFYIKIKQICKVLETKIKVLLSKISVSSKKAHQNISASIKKIHNKFNDSKTKAQLVNIREKINTKLQHKHSKKIIVSSLLLFSASALVIISVFSTRAAFIQNNKANNSKYNIIIETPRLISIENGKKHQFVASYKNYEYDPKNLLEVRIELINSKNEIFYSDPGIFNPKDKTIVFGLDKLPKDTIYTFRSIKILEQKKISDSSHKDIMFNTKSLIFNQSKSSVKLYDNNYVLMNLAIENNLNIPTQKLLNEVLKENYLPEQKEKIIDLLLDLVNKNYKSVLESNKINLADKELVIKLSNSEDKKFLEKDVYYFILNSKTTQQQNQTNDPEAILLSNKDKSIQFTITKDPFISANKLGKAIQNNKFDIKRLSSETLFGHNEDGANTYRIPGIIKLKNGTLIANADKRYDSLDDLGQNITQAIKFSYDNGRTWTKPKEILKVQIPSLNNQGLVIDGVMQEIEYLDTNTNTKKTKLLFLVDLFPAKFGIRNLKGGNPWVTIDNKNYLKLWTRNNSKLEGNSLLERVAGTQNWYRRVTLKNGKKFNNVTSSDLVPTNDYVDLNYHTETNTITGIVYNNIQSESELIKPQLLESKKSNYSVLDNGENSKYLIGVNDYIVSIESYDDGQTWTGLNWIYDDSFSKLYKDSNFIGTAVGNPIQLKHQKDPKLNGRIIVPAYGFYGTTSYYIYSDDFGRKWNVWYDAPKNPGNLTESSMIEANDGTIYWLRRNTRGGNHLISISTDGGKTWINPDENDRKNNQFAKNSNTKKNNHGNVFYGIGYFNLKEKDYFIFSTPKKRRRDGSLYIADKTFNDVVEVFDYDFSNKNQEEHFVYSYALTIGQTDEYVDVVVVYESSSKTKIPDNKQLHDSERTLAEEIQVDRFRIWLKDQK